MKMRFFARGALSLFSGLFLTSHVFGGVTPPGPATIVYNPPVVTVQNVLAANGGSYPNDQYFLDIKGPLAASSSNRISVTLGFSVLNAPIGVTNAVTFISSNPTNLTFSSPSQVIRVTITVAVPVGTNPGNFSWLIKPLGWPAAADVAVDNGATVNGLARDPPAVPVLPVIANFTPHDGDNFIYTGTPLTVPIAFDATVATVTDAAGLVIGGPVISSLGVSFDGTSISHTDTGLQTRSAHGSASKTNLTNPGPHTITVSAQNGNGTTTSTVAINIQAPPAITSANNNNAKPFVFGQAGSFQVTATGFPIPTFSVTGALPAGVMLNSTTGLLSGTPTTAGTYSFVITATNMIGTPAAAATATQNFTLTVNKAPLTITANSVSKAYGSANPAFTATFTGLVNGDASSVVSGLAFNTPATAASPAGSYAITPSSAAAANYSITFVAGTLTVAKAPLTITAADTTRAYGGSNPSFGATYSAFANGDTSSVVSGLAFTTTATASSPVGSYAITPSGATAANYTLTFVPGTLSVTKAALTVTAADATRPYGASNPSFTATYAGFVNGDTSAVVSGLAFSTPATTSSAAGTYQVSPTAATATNYTFTFAPGTLTVTKATLTVTADNKTKAAGTANPPLTATYGGLVNGDTSAVVSGVTLSTSATTTSAAGNYVIAVTGPAATTNYVVNYVAGMLTITGQTNRCVTSVLWLTPISLNKVQQGGSVLPIKFFLQQCCNGHTSRDHDDHGDDDHRGNDHGDNHGDDDHGDDNHRSGGTTCNHDSHGHSARNPNCRHDCDHDEDDDNGCANLRDTTVIITIYEVGSNAPAKHFVFGTGSPNAPDYAINGDYMYHLNFPTAKGPHRYHIDVDRFPPGATGPVLVGSKEFTTK